MMNKYDITNERQQDLLNQFYYTGIDKFKIKKLSIEEQSFLADTIMDNAINQIVFTFPALNIVHTGSIQFNEHRVWLDGKQKRDPPEYVEL